jgi:phospholipid/cholesterol/gamma-HCH transport system permease protein
MQDTQEIDALAVTGKDPVRYLVAPALLAMLLMMPVLTIIADAVGLLGAALYCAPTLDISVTAYLSQSLATLTVGDIGQGLAKSLVFAILITLIGCSTGFSVSGGAEGVGRATTRAVVLSISSLVIADMIFGYFMNR